MAFHEFGVGMTGTERVSGPQAGVARDFVSGHRNQIAAAAREYGVDALVLANVLYQERRHAGVDDYLQDRDPARHPNATLGPGQMNVATFKGLVNKGAVHLSANEASQYRANPDGFSRKYLIDANTGIEATAALISDRLKVLQDHNLIPKLRNDGNPNTLSLGQFVYGAALYSAGGRTDGGGGEAFDRKGPTTQHIDFKNNSLWGMVNTVKNDEKIIAAFHYLPDTYEAFYGKPAPDRLGNYFHDRSVLRGASRAALDGTGGDLSEPGVRTVAAAANAFGAEGQYGHELFKSVAAGVQKLETGLDPQQALNVSGALTVKSIEAQLGAHPALTANENGRIFAYEPKDTGRVAFVDASVAMAQSIEDSAGQARAQMAQAPKAAELQAPGLQETSAQSRGPSMA